MTKKSALSDGNEATAASHGSIFGGRREITSHNSKDKNERMGILTDRIGDEM
jgi:hypothetical protein